MASARRSISAEASGGVGGDLGVTVAARARTATAAARGNIRRRDMRATLTCASRHAGESSPGCTTAAARGRGAVALGTSGALRRLLQLLRPARFTVLLDLRLGDVLVLRAHHSEDRRRGILASRNRTQLLGALAPRLAVQRQTTEHARQLGRTAGRTFAAERLLDRLARTIQRLTLHEGAQLIGEIFD